MSTLELYILPQGPPNRAVAMLVNELDIDIVIKHVDVHKQENRSAEFLKMNPLHRLPVLNDDGFHLAESRAIMKYLCDKFDTSGKLYPADRQARAEIDFLLDFDLGLLFRNIGLYIYPQYFKGDPPAIDGGDVKEQLVFLNDRLSSRAYLAGDVMTIADISIAASLGLLEAVDSDITTADYPNIVKYQKTMSTLSYWKAVHEPFYLARSKMAAKRASNKH